MAQPSYSICRTLISSKSGGCGSPISPPDLDKLALLSEQHQVARPVKDLTSARKLPLVSERAGVSRLQPRSSTMGSVHRYHFGLVDDNKKLVNDGSQSTPDLALGRRQWWQLASPGNATTLRKLHLRSRYNGPLNGTSSEKVCARTGAAGCEPQEGAALDAQESGCSIGMRCFRKHAEHMVEQELVKGGDSHIEGEQSNSCTMLSTPRLTPSSDHTQFAYKPSAAPEHWKRLLRRTANLRPDSKSSRARSSRVG